MLEPKASKTTTTPLLNKSHVTAGRVLALNWYSTQCTKCIFLYTMYFAHLTVH